MEPLENARKNYLDMSPVRYLEGTHDARVHDVAFDGETLVLVSESWVGTDPIDSMSSSSFTVIYSRYRATFRHVENFELETLEPLEYPGPPKLEDFMQGLITLFKVALPQFTIATDDHEMRFKCKSFDIERFEPTKDDYQ